MQTMKDFDLKPGDIAYVNGTPIARAEDGTLKIAADARILTKGELLRPEEADTPAKKIYFVLQSMLVDPAHLAEYRKQLDELLCDRTEASSLNDVIRSLAVMQNLVNNGEIQAAMDVCRRLADFDAAILAAYPATGAEPR